MANRRVFYDFTLSPPKSLSVAALVAGDDRIVEAHRAAIRVAMAELEQFAGTQVHAGPARSERTTGNVIAALFEHDTSRALDPHLHTHCILFNATHDPVENRWKALETHGMLSAQKYVENVYYHELARVLNQYGYTVVNTARGDFEIAEVAPEVRELFSKRQREIDAKTRELLSVCPEKRQENIAAIREHIAHKDRAKKLPPVPIERLRAFWRGQMRGGEPLGIPDEPRRSVKSERWTAANAIDWAEEHLFERRSVVRAHEIWRFALLAARGSNLSLADLKAETARRGYVQSEGGKLSRKDVLAREWEIVELARKGIGEHPALVPRELRLRSDLAPDQQTAFERIVSSPDFVTLFRGGAGTGKSYVLRRVQETLTTAGYPTLVLAPQRQQVIDLERDGLVHTRTVSEFLQGKAMTPGSVLIVDEAGQIGGAQLLQLLVLAKQNGGRVILSGDTRQHGPVEAMDALRAIERYSGLRPAELSEIRRQDPERAKNMEERERIRCYREAVKAAAVGDAAASFDLLEQAEAITECSATEQSKQLTDAYLDVINRGESALVVSQTRAEVRAVNEAIRSRMRMEGKLEGKEHAVTVLEPMDLTSAQKLDSRFYPEGCTVVLNRAIKDAKAGTSGKLIATVKAGVLLEIDGRVRLIRRNSVGHFTVCRSQEIRISSGDRLQLKTNCKTADGRRLANGEVVTVAQIDSTGSIRLSDGRVIPPHLRQFVRGYAVTSYGSQGKTVDHVLFADSAVHAATNSEQWYVTISRGRKSVRIFTTDRLQLRSAITRCGNRELALDLQAARSPQGIERQRSLIRGLTRGRDFTMRVCLAAAARLRMPGPTCARAAQQI